MTRFLQTVRSAFLSGLVLFFCLIGAGVLAQDTGATNAIPARPSPPRLVNDFVGILQPGERQQLEEKLRRYNDSTSTQIVILIVRTTEPYPIGDYSFRVGREWGVGQQGRNNGLVLTWATQDRKVFIATGYGLEGAVPDAIAKRIVSQIITPRFKNEEWFAGLNEATDEIIRRATGEYKSDGSDEEGSSVLPILLVFFVVILILIWIGRNRGGGNRYRSGGPTIFPFPYTTYSGWGGSSGNWGGGGGGSDFGGFGGGDFGGGGAGGDY